MFWSRERVLVAGQRRGTARVPATCPRQAPEQHTLYGDADTQTQIPFHIRMGGTYTCGCTEAGLPDLSAIQDRRTEEFILPQC